MFICFGFVILRSFHAQDKRLVTLVTLNPILIIIYYFSCLCLAGLPFLSAFFSKDLMLEKLIDLSIEIVFVVILILILGVRVYYSFKLLNLISTKFAYVIIEKAYLGMIRIYIIMGVMLFIINIFLRMVFSVSLEILSIKIFIYLVVLIFLVFRTLTKLNFKVKSYDQILSFKEI